MKSLKLRYIFYKYWTTAAGPIEAALVVELNE